jgi:hypothetical protein
MEAQITATTSAPSQYHCEVDLMAALGVGEASCVEVYTKVWPADTVVAVNVAYGTGAK